MHTETSGLSSLELVRSQLESILLVIDSPASTEALARAVEWEEAGVATLLERMSADYDERGSGIDLRRTSDGWRFYTRQSNAEAVEKFLLDGSRTKLSRAALETLAVIAYRQPVTRAQISAVRGVNVDGVIRTLQMRGLIREVFSDAAASGPAGAEQEPSGGANAAHHGPRYYATTELFLEQLGIDSLERLPDLAPLLPDVDTIDEEL